MRIGWKMAALLAVATTTSVAAFAQQTPKWWEIACVHSKISVPAGLKCGTTQNYAGGQSGWASDAEGTFRNWLAAGELGGVQYFYYLVEATSPGVSITQATSLQDTIRSEMARGAQATGFSALANRGGADFMTFANASGDSCVGIRRYGPSQGMGYKWILAGVRCEPKGRTTSDSEIDRFISGATVRGL
jgi:hypothetical protein